MPQRASKLAVLAAVVVLFASFVGFVPQARAANYVSFITKGQNLKQIMGSFDYWTIYYNTDGTRPTLTADEPMGVWILCGINKTPTPVTPMSVYVWGLLPTGNQCGWVWVGNYQISPQKTNVSLTAGKGLQYKFVIANYQTTTPVYIQVR
ncbi:MAG: hypothetical protein ABIA74_00125 [bacterium]